jgi:hypothetical protein
MAKAKLRKRVDIYDGSIKVARTTVTRNLDFWNGSTNCNPTPGKHKSISVLADNRFALILSDDYLKKHIGFIIDNEEALIEILKANKSGLFYKGSKGKYSKLLNMYKKNEKKYDKIAEERGKKKERVRQEELVIVTKDNFLVEVFCTIATLKVTRINDTESKPKFNKIWDVKKNGLQKY